MTSDDGHASVGAVAFPTPEPVSREIATAESVSQESSPRAEHEPTVPNWLSRDEVSVWLLCV